MPLVAYVVEADFVMYDLANCFHLSVVQSDIVAHKSSMLTIDCYPRH